jgi:hypothetical protein
MYALDRASGTTRGGDRQWEAVSREMSIESRSAVTCPPVLVLAAARQAFRERGHASGRSVSVVFDSSRDDIRRDRSPRVLMFTGETFDLILTVATTHRGKAIGGAIYSATRVAVDIRRPLRATITLQLDETGLMPETVLPGGTACIVVRSTTGVTHQSNWFTL